MFYFNFLDPVIFKTEVEQLIKLNVEPKKNLVISKKAQLILPTHRLLDAAYEKAKGKDKIGSTLKGIGPTYQDKIGRQGLRVGDILLPDFRVRYETLRDKHMEALNFLQFGFELEESEKIFFEAIDFLSGFELIDKEIIVRGLFRS